MKIALFCDNFYPTVGGTETAVKELATALSKEHDVCVATIKGKKQKPDKQLFDFNVERTLSLKADKNNYLALPQLDRKFKKKMEQMDFDVIHCHSTASMAYFGLKLAKKKNIPFVITVHTKMKTAIKHHVKVGFVVNWLVKKMVKLLNKADAVYTVGENIANELKEYGYNGKVEVVRNGVSVKQTFDKNMLAQQLKQQYNLQQNVPVLLFVGRVIKYKNVGFILQVLANLKQRGQSFKAFIVGNGPDLNYFVKKAKKLNLGQEVVFSQGISDWKELSKYYAGADLLLFPSSFDTDGLVKYEAGAYQTPTCILENTGAAERLVHNQTAFIFKNDVNIFADQLSDLLQNPSLIKQVGENIKNNKFGDWNDTGKEYAKQYLRAIDNKKHKNKT